MSSNRWLWWYSTVSAILIVWGVIFTVFGLGVLPVEKKVLLEWESALYGAIMMGWGTSLFLVGRLAIQRHDSAVKRALLIGLAMWLIVEAALSARFGVWFNVGVDAGVFILFGAPLIASMRSSGSDDRWGSPAAGLGAGK